MAKLDSIDEVRSEFGLNGTQAEALDRFADLILHWRRANVTALRSKDEIVRVLLGDALSLVDVPELQERAGASWIDLGSGAGLPGIPLAVASSAGSVTLLESSAKKCAFLAEAVEVAGLANRARVVCARSEHHARSGEPGREGYAVVLARAVAPLVSLLELASPLLELDGVLVASKTGRAWDEEGHAAAVVADRTGMTISCVRRLLRSPLEDAVAVIAAKTASTPGWLPRREGLAVRRPL